MDDAMQLSRNLMERIAAPENLRLAFLKAVRGKRNRSEVQRYGGQLESRLERLRLQLLSEAVEVGGYRFFTVRDPKVREICAAPFGQRVLHYAIMNVCEPLLERSAIHDSYACRKGKGQHRAVHRAQTFCRQYPWYLKLDIKKYFDSISHEVLLHQLRRLVQQEPVVQVFARILDSYHTTPGCGLPIGNLISQHCANLYLGELDHWLKDGRGIKGYVRYMDDFIIWHESRAVLRSLLGDIRDFLAGRLALTLKDNIQLNRSERGVPFLGYRIFPGRVALGTASRKRFVRRFRVYEAKVEQGAWNEAQLCRHMAPLVEWTRHAVAGPFRAGVIKRYGVIS